MGKLILPLAVSTLLGFLSGLGIGGGSLLILWLTAVAAMEPGLARTVNLMFFVPSALVSILFRWRQGHLRADVVLPALVCGCVSAFCFSRLGVDPGLLKKLFGGFLILTGTRELFYREKLPSS